jgi:hypothetical protein
MGGGADVSIAGRNGEVKVGSSAATRGATIQRPGWGGADVGFVPFPANRVIETL